MKYKDLIHFEPVTEVIQLKSANSKEKAAQLVDTYVISDRMADVILHRIVPALKLGENNKCRGLFIVGNYGTGKSHLLSVITSIAEHADLLDHVKNEAVRKAMENIAGKFVVIRQETGASEMHLRDVVFSDLEKQLMTLGVEFHFPRMDEAGSNKQLLVEMMEKFKQVYPGKGLLIALDELLDFLRARNEKQMIMDLNFLRELGEASEILPLRFITGIQEALFDNPRFQFVGDSIKRVKSRFEQAIIVREDIAYVVSHRLLVKTEEQGKFIRKHLENFTALYSDMAERLDNFVEMFPVHPAYLEVFEQVRIGERRDLLKALSGEMSKMLDRDVPSNQPGLITYDSYWRLMSEDPSFRTIPDLRNVLTKAQVLSEKVRHAPETRNFKEPALRIIDGLALHRLTVSDIYAPIGITASEIRDRLCIHLPLPEQDADFLLATIETILKAISRAVNGQFITHNKENDQYYLDLKKDIDYDALIQEKADALDHSTIDRYYFDVISHALELNNTGSYVPGFRIWESEIPWTGHGITRRGYVFLGAANERSTAHPERDYYIHFQGIYGNDQKDLKHQQDEVYFKLSLDEKGFLELLNLYAGASEMSSISSGSNKDQYESKIRQTRSLLLQWLRDNFIRCFRVQHLENDQPITEVVAQYHVALRDQAFRDQVFRLCGAILNGSFSEKFPNYPCFQGVDLTSMSLPSASESALKAIGGGPNIRLAQCVLEGLGLGHIEMGHMVWTIEESLYAAHFQQLISVLEPGNVINRRDLLAGEPGAERDTKFNLEPELLLVVLASLIRQGSLTMLGHGVQITDTDLTNGTKLDLEQLLHFTSISKPKPMPEQAVRELFTQFGIEPEVIKDPHTLSLGVTQLQLIIQNELNLVVRMIESLRNGPRFWQEMILPSTEQQGARKELEDFKQFLTGLQNLTTVARLANLSVEVGEIRSAVKARQVMHEVQKIFDILQDLGPAWEYLVQAQPILPAKDDWQTELNNARQYVISILSDPVKRNGPNVSGQLRGRLENLQSGYIARYLVLHKDHRLDRDQDALKRQLTSDPRWAQMRALSRLSLLPTKQLKDLQDRLGAVETCPNLQPVELKSHPHCPHCGFNPVAVPFGEGKASTRLELVSKDFEALCKNWVEVLCANLQTEEAVHHLKLVDAVEREAVEEFLRTRQLPEPLTERFLSGVENTLQGLEVLVIDGGEYLMELTRPGMPCTPDELEKRIREFLQKNLEGKDRRKIRIQINW